MTQRPDAAAASLATLVRLLIVALTVVLLGAMVQHAISVTAAPLGHFVVTALPDAAASPSEQAGDSTEALRVATIVVDGRRLRPQDLPANTGWDTVSSEGYGVPSLRRSAAVPAPTFAFDGHGALLQLQGLPWHGRIRVQRDSVEVANVHLARVGSTFLLEVPATSPSWLAFVAVVIVVALLAWRVAPVRGREDALPWLLFVLAVWHACFWATQGIGVENDASPYLEGINALQQGAPSYFTPGYPLLLWIVRAATGERFALWVTALQHAMVVASGVWTYRILRRYTHELVAMVGGLLAGGLPSVLMASQGILADAATMFALVGGCWFALRASDGTTWRAALVAGLLMGWGTLLRVASMVALGPAAAALQLANPGRRFWRAALPVAVAALAVAAPLAWTGARSGHPSLTYASGLHLFNRAVQEGDQLADNGPASMRLASMLGDADPAAMQWWDVTTHPAFATWSEADASRLLYDVSLEAIRARPASYFLATPSIAWQEFVADAGAVDVAWGTTPWQLPVETSPILRVTRAGLEWRQAMRDAHARLWPLLCAMAIGGLLVGWAIVPVAVLFALVWIPTAYLLTTALLDEFVGRHNIVLVPFVVALAMLSVQGLLRARERFALVIRRLADRERDRYR